MVRGVGFQFRLRQCSVVLVVHNSLLRQKNVRNWFVLRQSYATYASTRIRETAWLGTAILLRPHHRLNFITRHSVNSTSVALTPSPIASRTPVLTAYTDRLCLRL